jgi:hypothetical protein
MCHILNLECRIRECSYLFYSEVWEENAGMHPFKCCILHSEVTTRTMDQGAS